MYALWFVDDTVLTPFTYSFRLRSPKAPDANADMGCHTFSYAIMPHLGKKLVIEND